MGEAEEHQGWAALQILIGDHFPVLIRQLERSADGGDLLRHRRRQASGHDQDDTEAKHEPGGECRRYQENADVARGHVGSLCPAPASIHRQAAIPATIIS